MERRRSKLVKPSREGKLPVPEPTTPLKFFALLVMHVCKKILFIDTSIKAGLYMCGATAVSLVTDLLPLPKTYIAHKHNIFNVFFVKFGWGWTAGLLLLFIYLTSNVYCLRDMRRVKRHMVRMMIGTFIWYTCTSLFDYVENATGECTEGKTYQNKRECRRAGGTWVGFDISGHAFLLIYCLLMISEEVKCLKGWERIPELIKSEEENPTGKLDEEKLGILKMTYEEFTPYIRLVTIVLTVFVILWEMMLVSTILYHHNMPQKLSGALFAVAMWFFTYNVWFRFPSSPGMPGKGLVKYVKE